MDCTELDFTVQFCFSEMAAMIHFSSTSGPGPIIFQPIFHATIPRVTKYSLRCMHLVLIIKDFSRSRNSILKIIRLPSPPVKRGRSSPNNLLKRLTFYPQQVSAPWKPFSAEPCDLLFRQSNPIFPALSILPTTREDRKRPEWCHTWTPSCCP